MKPMHYALALSATIAVAGLAFTASPAAASAMATCNKQWNDETAANATNGVTYQDFLKGCLKKASTTAAPAAATTTTTTAAAPAAGTTTMAATDTTTTTTTVDPATAKAKKDCGAQYKAAKADGSLGTQKKKDFIDACLTKAGIAVPVTTKKPATTTTTTTTTPAVTTPPATTTMAPATTPTTTPSEPTATTTKTKTTDANGKPKTPGQLARDKRIEECGTEWKAAKAAGTTNGLKWPQFWSACDKKLKAAAG